MMVCKVCRLSGFMISTLRRAKRFVQRIQNGNRPSEFNVPQGEGDNGEREHQTEPPEEGVRRESDD